MLKIGSRIEYQVSPGNWIGGTIQSIEVDWSWKLVIVMNLDSGVIFTYDTPMPDEFIKAIRYPELISYVDADSEPKPGYHKENTRDDKDTGRAEDRDSGWSLHADGLRNPPTNLVRGFIRLRVRKRKGSGIPGESP